MTTCEKKRTQITNIRHGKGDIATEMQKEKDVQGNAMINKFNNR